MMWKFYRQLKSVNISALCNNYFPVHVVRGRIGWCVCLLCLTEVLVAHYRKSANIYEADIARSDHNVLSQSQMQRVCSTHNSHNHVCFSAVAVRRSVRYCVFVWDLRLSVVMLEFNWKIVCSRALSAQLHSEKCSVRVVCLDSELCLSACLIIPCRVSWKCLCSMACVCWWLQIVTFYL